MKAALDTNILVYAQGLNGAAMRHAALDLIEALPADSMVLPAQTLSELFQVLVREARFAPAASREVILSWCDLLPVVDTSPPVVLGAAELAVTHRVSFWDGLILASAAEAGCRLLLSEDFQHGFTWNSVTVANPFKTPQHPLLQSLLIDRH